MTTEPASESWVGDDDDGCTIRIYEEYDDTWRAVVVADCVSSIFDGLRTERAGFAASSDALEWGTTQAQAWCITNEVEYIPRITPEQHQLLEEIKEELLADVEAIEAHLLHVREIMAQRIIAPRMQKVADMFNTGVDANGGLVWLNDARLRDQPIIESMCHEISDHFWERLLPAGHEGHAYVANAGIGLDKFSKTRCRVCGKAEEKHDAAQS